jgi:biotin carboxylase
MLPSGPPLSGCRFPQTGGKASLLFCPLSRYDQTRNALEAHLSRYRLSPGGIACFDCESLMMASRLALHFKKPFPMPEAIFRTRNKQALRQLLGEAGIGPSEAPLVSGLDETLGFFRRIKRDIVLKPLSGSGSELLFHCRSEEEIRQSVRILKEQLPRRRSNPLFSPISHPDSGGESVDPCQFWLAEEYIGGPEFSCDFVLRDGMLTILRETGKVKAPDQTFGSVLAYTYPPAYPPTFSRDRLHRVLKEAARALELTWGYFMVDFILQDGKPVIIEMTPRPGGDSIPDLVKTATGRDILGFYLDMVSGRPIPSASLPPPSTPFSSINLFASQSGVIAHLDPSRILSKSWVRRLVLKKRIGDRIHLPPDDYDNRFIGYCIVALDSYGDLIPMACDLQALLDVSISNYE